MEQMKLLGIICPTKEKYSNLEYSLFKDQKIQKEW